MDAYTETYARGARRAVGARDLTPRTDMIYIIEI